MAAKLSTSQHNQDRASDVHHQCEYHTGLYRELLLYHINVDFESRISALVATLFFVECIDPLHPKRVDVGDLGDCEHLEEHDQAEEGKPAAPVLALLVPKLPIRGFNLWAARSLADEKGDDDEQVEQCPPLEEPNVIVGHFWRHTLHFLVHFFIMVTAVVMSEAKNLIWKLLDLLVGFEVVTYGVEGLHETGA